jgi:hypothetical protein
MPRRRRTWRRPRPVGPPRTRRHGRRRAHPRMLRADRTPPSSRVPNRRRARPRTQANRHRGAASRCPCTTRRARRPE